jgi:hypothetical protein
VKEILYTLQAICPLVAFLLMVLFCLKEPIPIIIGFINTEEDEEAAGVEGQFSVASPRGPYESSVAIPPSQADRSRSSQGRSVHASIADDGMSGRRKTIPLWLGLSLAMFGIMTFNIGLTNGLTSLGDSVGGSLPALFEEIPSEEIENATVGPFHERDLGLFIALAFSWALGLGATLAEPALNNLGRIVELNSNGKFTKKMVTSSVSTGVSLGLMVGVLKIVAPIELIYLILPLYPLAIFMTAGSDEDIVCIAWDSAGVTTGEITVPLVLALGTGISKTDSDGGGLPEGGFGILTMCSVAPIMFMLLMGIVVKKSRKAQAGVSRPGSDRSQQGSAMEEPATATGKVTLLHTQDNTLHDGDKAESGTSTSSSGHYVAPDADAKAVVPATSEGVV